MSLFSDIGIWIDGKAYEKNSVPWYLLPYFKQTDDKNLTLKLNVVGIHLQQNNLHVMLPKNLSNTDRNIEDDVTLLVKGLTNNQFTNSTSSNDEPLVKQSDLFSVISWLINDFKKHGIYRTRFSYKDRQKGKINWNKTIKNEIPVLNHGSLSIIEFSRTHKKNMYTEISMIHSYIMKTIADNYGLFFQRFSFKKATPTLQENKITDIKKILIRAMKHTKVNRELYLFKNILIFLDLIKSNNRNLSIVTTEFHVLFEQLVKVFVNHDSTMMDYVPQAIWNFKLPSNLEIQKHISSQIPDALVKQNGRLDIYDPKYYDLTYFESFVGSKNTKAVPLDWYSLGKQFFYDISFDYKSSGLKEGQNSFVFPFRGETLELHSIGQVTISFSNNVNKIIHILIIDPMKLMEHCLQ